MNKRIIISIISAAVITMVLTAVTVCVVFYRHVIEFINSSELLSEVLFASFAPFIVIIAIICIGAFQISKRWILKPLTEMDVENNLISEYDELAPFIKTISRQRDFIADQLSVMQRRSDTVDTIMDNMSEGLVLVDSRGVVVSINRQALTLLGVEYSAEGNNILEIIRDLDFLTEVRIALSGNNTELIKEYPGKIYRFIFSPVFSDAVSGGGAIVLILDVTDKTMAETMRREFSANVSHELKTPLTSISGYAEMLSNGMVKANDSQLIAGKIRDEAQRLISLIEDIIMISKLDEGQGSASFEEVDITEIANSVKETLLFKSKENNISVEVKGDSVRLLAIRSMMHELLFNLIDNAIKYNNSGGSVRVKISKVEGKLELTVEDTGIGIPKDSIDRVFERFYRVDKSRSKKISGTGLGLAIVKHIVIIHNGTISVESSDKGTKITVRI